VEYLVTKDPAKGQLGMTLWRTRKSQRSGSLTATLSLLLAMSWRAASCSFITCLQFRQNCGCCFYYVKVWRI